MELHRNDAVNPGPQRGFVAPLTTCITPAHRSLVVDSFGVTKSSVSNVNRESVTIESDKQDSAAMVRLAGADDAALNDLMSRHAPRLANYLARCLQNEEDAADLTQ